MVQMTPLWILAVIVPTVIGASPPQPQQLRGGVGATLPVGLRQLQTSNTTEEVCYEIHFDGTPPTTIACNGLACNYYQCASEKEEAMVEGPNQCQQESDHAFKVENGTQRFCLGQWILWCCSYY